MARTRSEGGIAQVLRLEFPEGDGPQLLKPSTDRHVAWNLAQVPLHYAAHETFEPARNGLDDADGRVVFRYLGQPVADDSPAPAVHPAAQRGIARAVPMPTPYETCSGDAVAPRSGVWLALMSRDDPRAAAINHWVRQRYVTKGHAFPTLVDAPSVEHADLTWYCCGQSNEERGEGWSQVRLNDSAPPAR